MFYKIMVLIVMVYLSTVSNFLMLSAPFDAFNDKFIERESIDWEYYLPSFEYLEDITLWMVKLWYILFIGEKELYEFWPADYM